MRSWLLLVVLAALACAGKESPAPRQAAIPPGRDTWWKQATTGPGGAERVLAPRELRALLVEGRTAGFEADPAWWSERAKWAYERILQVDHDDLEANAGSGRRTLQSMEGFADLWRRMQEAPPDDEILELLDQYDPWVQEGRPIFLAPDEYAVLRARLTDVAKRIQRFVSDPAFAAVQSLLRRVKHSVLADYPYVQAQFGPFVVFYTAPDLAPIDEPGDAQRLAARKTYYLKRLAAWRPVYEGLLADLAKLYPGLWKDHAPGPGRVFPEWVFAEAEEYADFVERRGKQEAQAPYRKGFFDGATGWAYLLDVAREETQGKSASPAGPTGETRECAAYLAAVQLLRVWGRNPKNPIGNRLDTSEAYWLKEGWPAYLAARRVEVPLVGRILSKELKLPALQDVVGRRSRLQQRPFLLLQGEAGSAPVDAPDGGYTDLAWLLVRALNTPRRRPAFIRFLRSQIESDRRGVGWFEECFGVRGPKGWKALQAEVYGFIGR